MRKLIVILLIAVAGCATPTAPKPMQSEIAQEQQPVHVAPKQEQLAEKPAAIATQPVSPSIESASTVTPMVTEGNEEVKHQSAEAHKSDEELRPPVVASKQPHVPQIEQQTKRPLPEVLEKPIPEHRLQSLATLAIANDEKIMNVFVGMYRNTVDTIMGSDRNPYRKIKITGMDSEVYDVLFYLTREPRPGKPITERMLSPVIFRKGRVVAMGNYQLKKLIRNGTLERHKPVLGAK